MDWPLLEDLNVQERLEVVRTARRRRFRRSEVVFHEGDSGDSLHLVVKGRVSVGVTTPLGDHATLAVLGPGAAFGELALVGSGHLRTASVAALESTETISLTRVQFDQLRRAHPGVDRMLIRILAMQVMRLTEQLLESLYIPAETRLLRRLDSLAHEYGNGEVGTVIPLTQEYLATMAGTSRATANRVLSETEAAGAIRVGRGKLVVVDPALLARRAR